MSEYKYQLKKIYQPSPDQVILQVGNKDNSPVFNFKPGQYAMISYKNSQGKNLDKHAFSIASSPTKSISLEFGIKIQGSFTKGLLLLKEGDELIISGPYGDFVYDEKKYLDAVMIAGGIGITPFFSALNYASDLNLPNKLSIIYSCRNKPCATYYKEITELTARNRNISYLFSFTDESSDSDEGNVIHKRIDANIIKEFIGTVNGRTFFVCGPSLFMKSMVDNLTSLGVQKNQIKMEEFSMIPDNNFRSRFRNFLYATSFAVVIFVVTYVLITKPAFLIKQKKYDPFLIYKTNQAAYERMILIYDAKNKALADLNNKILAAQGSTTRSITFPNNSVQTQPAPTIITSPAPTPIQQPVIIPIPTPRTSVS